MSAERGGRHDAGRPGPGAIEVVAHDHPLAEARQERCRAVEVGHLHEGRAEGLGARGRRCPLRRPRSWALANSAARSFRWRSDVLALNTSMASTRPAADQLDERGLGEVAAHRVEGMGDVDHAALVADAPAGLLGRHAEGHVLGEEQPDDLAGMGPQLLADDDPARQPRRRAPRRRGWRCGR